MGGWLPGISGFANDRSLARGIVNECRQRTAWTTSAAGSLAEELPWWGWLDDERSCLTRAGELMSLARISPFVLDGQTPEQLRPGD